MPKAATTTAKPVTIIATEAGMEGRTARRRLACYPAGEDRSRTARRLGQLERHRCVPVILATRVDLTATATG